MISDIERIQWRLKRIENFLGKSDNKSVTETINDLNEQLLRYASSNNNARKLLNKADDINRFTSQRFLLRDRSTKLELILADEERIHDITKKLSEIDTLARVLDGECFQEIPKLSAMLNKLLIVHDKTKNEYGEYHEELSRFLQDYAAFNLTMDENLQQYKRILHKNDQVSSITEDNPIE